MGTTSSITMQSLGKIVQRTPAVGAKMWCFFCWSRSESVTYLLTVRSRGTQFEQALRCRLLPDFDEVFIFFVRDSSFRCTTQFSHSSLSGATIFAKLRSRIAKSPKIGGKDCAHHFVQIADRFEENSTAEFQVVICRYVHLYKNFCARRYLALTESVKFRIGSPKTARNEQVCAHQKSYRN